VTADDLEGTKYAKGARYIAHLHPDQTKTRLQYRWWLREEDRGLYERLVAAREYHGGPKPLSCRQVQYRWDSMMQRLGIQTSNKRPHTLYSLRRAIAQQAYDERLEEEYIFGDQDDEEDEDELDGPPGPAKGAAKGLRTPNKAIRKPPKPSKKAQREAQRRAG
jgi:hypothetical protein